MTALHQASVYQQDLCRLIGTVFSPTLQSLAMLAWQQQLQERQLREQNATLKVGN